MASFDMGKYKAVQNSVPEQKKTEWNGFIDYLKNKGMSGNKMLDARDTNLGKQLLEQYKTENPTVSLNYEDVPVIQQWFNKYRNDAWNAISKGKAKTDVATIDEFMPNLSPVDGWLGSKTSQTYFPRYIKDGKDMGFATVNY
jgi:hypothetical protein